jgi:hypothetical protein
MNPGDAHVCVVGNAALDLTWRVAHLPQAGETSLALAAQRRRRQHPQFNEFPSGIRIYFEKLRTKALRNIKNRFWRP